MEKQNKTFGSLTMMDKLYKPYIDEIREIEIEGIERRKNQQVKISYNYSDYVIALISNTVVDDDYHSKICVNKGKAIEIQKELRNMQRNKLQKDVQEAINRLNEFVNKYY